MAVKTWPKTAFLLVLYIQRVSGGTTYTSSDSKTALSQPIIPCYIDYYKEGSTADSSNITIFGVSIASSWRRHKGCVFKLQLHNYTKKIELKNNSPGLCSMVCESTEYFGVWTNLCICLKKLNVSQATTVNRCKQQCPNQKIDAFCGSSDPLEYAYYDVYEHNIDMKQKPHKQDKLKNTCLVAKYEKESKVTFQTVPCLGKHEVICFLENGDPIPYLSNFKPKAGFYGDGCQFFGDTFDENVGKLPSNRFVWTPFIRSEILLHRRHKDNSSEKHHSHSKCQLEIFPGFEYACLSVNNRDLKVPFRCNFTKPTICTVHRDEDMCKESTRKVNDYHSTENIPMSLGYTSDHQKISVKRKPTSPTMSTYFEPHSISANAFSTPKHASTTIASTSTLTFENSVFAFQIGIAISVCCLVILIAVIACCMYRPKRGTYTFPISRSEENIVMAVEGNASQPTAVLADNYSEPVDKASTSNEVEGPRFCASKPCQNTNYEKTENGEYHHLDFTMRSETATRFADNSEYDHVRANVISVFDQPWDTATSKVNKLFSQISKSVVVKGQNIRKSFIKRRESRSGSPKLKRRSSDYCEAWQTQLNNQQFAFDSDVDNKINVSKDEAVVDSSKHDVKIRRTDSAFPVLPYSERIYVKSTHIYDEPDDRRMSLRERLLHMISMRPLKMPFGIELDLRASRSKSKIYSLATSIDETDESAA